MPFRQLRPVFAAILVVMFTLGFSSVIQAQKGGASPAQPTGAAPSGGGASPYFETEMLAYGAVNQISEAVAQRVCNAQPQLLTPNATILIFDQQSFQNLGAWQSFAAGAEMLEDAYNTLPSGKAGVQLFGAPASPSASFIQGGADLGSLITAIAASTSNTASAFSIPNETMAVSLMHAFERINCNINVIYYPLFGSYADLKPATEIVREALKQLNEARQNAQKYADDQGVKNTDILFTELTDLNTQYDMLLKDFLTLPGQSSSPGGGGGAPPSATGTAQVTVAPNAGSTTSSGSISLVQGAELEELIKKEDTHILYANIVAAGGTQRDIKNVFTLFTGDWLSYSGGLIVDIALVKSKETALEFADTLRYRTDFHHRDLWDVLGFKPFHSPKESQLVESTNAGSNMTTLCNQESRHKPKSLAYCPVAVDALATPAALPARLVPLLFDQKEVSGGTQLSGAVSLTTKATANVTIQLFSSDRTVLPIPANVQIPAGSIFAPFKVQANVVPEQKHVVVSEIDQNNNALSVIITVNPALLAFASTTVKGGTNLKGTIRLRGQAPPGGAKVMLVSSDPSIQVTNVDLNPGDTSKDFNVTTTPVAAKTSAVISATYKDLVESVLLIVTP